MSATRCGVCGQVMAPGVQCVDRAPLVNRALEGGYRAAGDECRDCCAPCGGNHHSTCEVLWCEAHGVQVMLCRDDHGIPENTPAGLLQ